MIRTVRWLLFFLCLLIIQVQQLYAWGPPGHRWIVERALDVLDGTLLQPLRKLEIQILDHVMDADDRRARDPDEYHRHFVNLERYGDYPFTKVLLGRSRLEAQLGSAAVKKNGTLLWALQASFERLVTAFRIGGHADIAAAASDLAHYAGDLYQPLHTTENYDGQLSGQKGLHARYENGLLVRQIGGIKWAPRTLLDNAGELPEYLYQAALDSHGKVAAILDADRTAVLELGIRRQRFEEKRGKPRPYPDAYYELMATHVGGDLDKQLQQAAGGLALLWWSAWTEAGRPSLQ